jgi:hypothetical protein
MGGGGLGSLGNGRCGRLRGGGGESRRGIWGLEVDVNSEPLVGTVEGLGSRVEQGK